ncbi:hypothetical protein [Bacillus sp. J37]|uniref:hypothetical protein n=1 Tax=Bacillus sp. J37 TaxID=935837 RepID=UPI000479BB3A|nr:hypothetical protein [Bacillus sp. J37]
MLDGLHVAIDQFIETRLETLQTSEEYAVYIESIYNDLEEKLLLATESLQEQEKVSIIEDIKSNIYDQVFYMSKQAYRQGFSDSINFYMSQIVMSKK